LSTVRLESSNGTTLVRFDRPPANALDPDLVEELVAAAEELREARPRAVVLTGRKGFFSAGLDLKAVPSLDAEAQGELIMDVNRMVAGWYSLPHPVVVAVSGHAIAGGLILALCGDHRVGATVGKLGLTEIRAGIPYPAAAIALVRAELSPPAARALVLRGELLEPAAALELGLLDELAEPDALVARALEIAGELAGLPADTYARIKRQLRGDVIAEIDRIVTEKDDPLASSWLAAETAEAASATLSQGS
jgi:enoyl-CoA hydratase